MRALARGGPALNHLASPLSQNPHGLESPFIKRLNHHRPETPPATIPPDNNSVSESIIPMTGEK